MPGGATGVRGAIGANVFAADLPGVTPPIDSLYVSATIFELYLDYINYKATRMGCRSSVVEAPQVLLPDPVGPTKFIAVRCGPITLPRLGLVNLNKPCMTKLRECEQSCVPHAQTRKWAS